MPWTYPTWRLTGMLHMKHWLSLGGQLVMWSRMNTQTFRGFSPELGRVLKIYKMPIDELNNNFNRKYFNIQ